MKKTFIFLCLIFTSLFVFASEYDLQTVPIEFYGTYIPVTFDKILQTTLNYEESLHYKNVDHHDILLLSEGKCFSDLKFHDGYAIRKEEFDNFSFVKNNDKKYMIDDKENLYKQISTENSYSPYYKYVLDIVFKDAKELKSLEILNNGISIDGKNFDFLLDSLFLEGKNVAMWFRNDDGIFGLVIDKLSAKLYKTKKNSEMRGWILSEEIEYEFPIFKYEYKFVFELNKTQLRNYRNMIYAKHGYIFKDENLKKLFSQFEWYNPQFTNVDGLLTQKEKDLINRIQRAENSK